MKTIFTIALATAALAGYFSSYTPEPQEPMPVFTEAVKRPAKLFYDRIEVGVEPVRVQRCKTPGTIWYRNACWRPERIVANAR